MCVRLKHLYPAILVCALLCVTPAGAEEKSAKPKAASGPASARSDGNGLQRRIDFGNSYILGQSIKSGAVYLLHRKKSEIKSMLHYRENYREEILDTFSVDADSELGQNIAPEIASENLNQTTKKTVLK